MRENRCIPRTGHTSIPRTGHTSIPRTGHITAYQHTTHWAYHCIPSYHVCATRVGISPSIPHRVRRGWAYHPAYHVVYIIFLKTYCSFESSFLSIINVPRVWTSPTEYPLFLFGRRLQCTTYSCLDVDYSVLLILVWTSLTVCHLFLSGRRLQCTTYSCLDVAYSVPFLSGRRLQCSSF